MERTECKHQVKVSKSHLRSGWTRSAATLYRCTKRSLWNVTLHRARDGCWFLKIKSFLFLQIFHIAHVAISMKHGPLKFLRAVANLWEMCSELSHWRPITFQQDRANWQSKNRWSLVSSWCELQRTQEAGDSKVQCFLSIKSFVFNLSFCSNQAKMRSLGRHFDFQIACREGSCATLEKTNL